MPPKQAKTKKAVKNVAKAQARLAKAVLAPRSVASLVKGRGDYTHPSRFVKVAGRGDYSSILSGLGGGLGSLVDTGAGLFKAITGLGDYRGVAAGHQKTYETSGIEGAFTSAFSNPNPLKMGAMNVEFGGGKPTVAHREFVGVILGSSAFKTTSYRIQPGLRGPSVLMPWGSSVAAAFQQYELEGMILEYVSTSTNYSSSTSLGSVMMSTQYNATATPYGTQREVDNAEFTTASAPDKSFIHPIECSTADSPVSVRYVRSNNATSAGTDERLDDVGVFQISTFGQPVNDAAIGELWVTYKVRFLKPELADFHAGTTYLSTTEGDGTSPFLLPAKLNANNSLPCIMDLGGELVMPNGYAGNYILTITCSGVTETTRLVNIGTGITPLNVFMNGTEWLFISYLPYPQESSLPQSFSLAFNFNGDQSNGVISLAGSIANGSFATLSVLPLDNDISSAFDVSSSVSNTLAAQENELATLRKQVAALMVLSKASSSPPKEPPTPSASSLAWAARMEKLRALAAVDVDAAERELSELEYQTVEPELFSPSSVPARMRNNYMDVAETSLTAAILAKAKVQKL